ncbi:unnamed protein product [Oppiella nova]|uniref:Small integral membrane protein 8 n=1 Tax=Oppiella nova TaxID=334625 RepID=A0A7R9LDT0_9ACAR|nr:unnamed protein product [Oppiella nova]CAG2162564.1 unnamed protein product [Oppiella nova]
MSDKREPPKGQPIQSRVEPKGDGIRSMGATNVFRVVNFELFVKPNKYAMSAGVCALTLCFGYIFYMNYKARADPSTYIALNEDETQTIQRRQSKWQ